ncbi:MipA/OmpV family protein [Pseudomonas sp. R2.Fl]|nr:MipA/OmpV family protein [Pseudomonas sp. R2.Fl]
MSFFKRTDPRLASSALCLTFILIGTASRVLAADAGFADQPPEPFDQDRFTNEQAKPDWTIIVGAGAMYEPEYEGSDEMTVSPVPFVVINYGEWLEIDPTGVTVTALRHEGFSLGAKIGYESGRDEDDHERLEGLGDIDFAATVGARATYNWNGLELYAMVDQTIDGSESLIGTFGIEYSAPVTERLILGAGAEAIVANDKHMEAYFGVNAAQSAASGLPEYEAKAGLKRVNVSASATYMLTENWLVRGEAGVGFLTGDAADSPIVEEEIQPSASLFVGYKF